MEEHLRRSMLIGNGDPSVFFTRPVSLGLMLCSIGLLVLLALPSARRTREKAFEAE
jgi:putative tricarboxylic transport membrane protein